MSSFSLATGGRSGNGPFGGGPGDAVGSFSDTELFCDLMVGRWVSVVVKGALSSVRLGEEIRAVIDGLAFVTGPCRISSSSGTMKRRSLDLGLTSEGEVG